MRPVSDYGPVWASDTRSLRREHSPFQRVVVKPGQRVNGHDNDSDSDSLNVPQDHEYIRPRSLSDSERLDPFNVAGYDPQRHLPAAPFPHADTTRETSYTRIRPYPDLVSSTNLSQDNALTSIQKRHLTVVTSILHTSLLKGDWARAARAWGLILQTVHAGKYLDFRTRERWGIGAEVLLQQDSQTEHGQHNFSRNAFQAAKDYFEQLILQYPYVKSKDRGFISALDFYPALFGLCVYEAVTTSAVAVSHLEDPDFDRFTDEVPDLVGIKTAELEAALRIGTRLDTVLVGPPYDRHVQLLQLRGMIALWTADLYQDVTGQPGVFLPCEWSSTSAASNVQQAGIERAKARRFLTRAVDVGGRLPRNLQIFLDNHV